MERERTPPGSGSRGLHRFAVLTAVCTFALIVVGGLVTSTGSGLAVPDWPLSFGQLFPPLVGGVLYEHGHRMVAAGVGVLTVALAVWAWRREPRRWVRALAVTAVVAVVAQGLLGGITVLLRLPTAVSVAHACLAQAFFGATVVLALCTGPAWAAPPQPRADGGWPAIWHLALATTIGVYVQLVSGAVVRHTGSGLAIPDFPLAFGRLVPPAFPAPVLIHFLHRLGAVAVTLLVVWTVARVWGAHGGLAYLRRPAMLLLALLVVQLALGAGIIWSWRAVVATTAHVAVGAAVLAVGLVLTLRAWQTGASSARRAETGWRPEQVAA